MDLARDFQIVTARCRLRYPAEGDLAHFFAASRFAGFNDGMKWEPPATVEELRGPLQENLRAWDAGTSFSFTIERADGSGFLGRISIRSTPAPSVWDLGFWLHPDRQGQGYMTESASAVVDFGFGRLGAVAIEACHASWNVRSRRVLERLGMTEVELIPHGFMKRGQWVQECRMRLERGEWERRSRVPVQPGS